MYELFSGVVLIFVFLVNMNSLKNVGYVMFYTVFKYTCFVICKKESNDKITFFQYPLSA